MAGSKNNDWLKASEIGHYAWSPEGWLDRRLGVELDTETLEKMKAGERYHRRVALRTDWAVLRMRLGIAGVVCVFLVLGCFLLAGALW